MNFNILKLFKPCKSSPHRLKWTASNWRIKGEKRGRERRERERREGRGGKSEEERVGREEKIVGEYCGGRCGKI